MAAISSDDYKSMLYSGSTYEKMETEINIIKVRHCIIAAVSLFIMEILYSLTIRKSKSLTEFI